MIPRADEKRAQRLVLANIEAALAEMRVYVLRELAAGRVPDKRMMVAMTDGLAKLADEYSIDLMAGPYGDMIADAMKAAAAEVADIAGRVAYVADRATIDAALYAAGQKIKGIAAEGISVVQEELLKSIVGGRSQRELADAIADRLQVADKAGDLGEIPSWRAELIARNELSINYSMTKFEAAKEAGFKEFKMVGPDDERTDNDICSRYLGQVHTAEEWQEIADSEGLDPAYPVMVFKWHINCRHDFIPTADSLEA